MFYIPTLKTFDAQRANFATQRSSLNICLSCHVTFIVSAFLVSNLFWNRLNMWFGSMGPCVKCTRVGTTTAIDYLFLRLHVKRAPQLFVFWYTRYRLHNDSAGLIRCVYSNSEPSSSHSAEVSLFPPAFLLCCAWASPRPTYASPFLMWFASLLPFRNYLS